MKDPTVLFSVVKMARFAGIQAPIVTVGSQGITILVEDQITAFCQIPDNLFVTILIEESIISVLLFTVRDRRAGLAVARLTS